ncbi:MAG: hypothetical protein M3O91_09915 [Chloroflexota bacterium]|nr:hypothetical protein [Chloroflexota bacterium]
MSELVSAARGAIQASERLRLLSLAIVTAVLLVAFLFLEASDLISQAGGV